MALINNMKRFYKEVAVEMEKVTWPTRQEVVTYTAVVIVATFILSAFIYAVDFGVGRIVRLIFSG